MFFLPLVNSSPRQQVYCRVIANNNNRFISHLLLGEMHCISVLTAEHVETQASAITPRHPLDLMIFEKKALQDER